MNTLTGIEADRVSMILRHALDRLQLLSYVPTSWNDELFAEINCTPVLNSLERQWLAEDQLRLIYEESGNGAEGGGKEINAIKQAHRATRATCRNLLADRATLQVIMSRPEHQSTPEFSKFIRYLHELKDQINTRLTTTVEDEAANRTTLHDLTEKERKMEESRDALQAKLTEVREEKERVSFTQNQTLKKLQHELQDISQHNAVEMASVHKDMSEAINKAMADHDLRMRQLQDQLDAMERQSAELTERNREEEHRLRKEKARTESALAAKIQQYDEDMSERQRTLEELNTLFMKESQEYAILKEHFDRLDFDQERQNEENAILSLAKKREDFGRLVLFKAAQAIQKIVRGRQGRERVSKLKSKGKKGGKGGKKGK